MVEIEKPRITCLDTPEDASYGKYVVEPLERGYSSILAWEIPWTEELADYSPRGHKGQI